MLTSCSFKLMMEGAGSFKTSVNFYLTAQCDNTEDSHIQCNRREDLKLMLKNASTSGRQ